MHVHTSSITLQKGNTKGYISINKLRSKILIIINFKVKGDVSLKKMKFVLY